MQSKKLLKLAELKKNLKNILKNYNEIKDIIIFGSFVKNKEEPKDIDIALIVEKKDINLTSKLKKEIPADIHISIITENEILTNPLTLTLINEGYSIVKEDYIKNILKIKPMKLYSYNLMHLNNSSKTLFNIALKKTLKKINGEKISPGSVLIPMEQTGYFEEFLDAWQMKYKTKEWNVF